MSDSTDVFLITGFLGSGKTTFLNRIVNRFPEDKKLTLLVNEFGEIGIDGTLIEGEGNDMMEISKGSIFCVCVKTDFIKGLYELNNTVRPDVLLIESTGVANPSDLKKDLQLPIFNDRFQFKEQFCIIDAAHFLDAYEVYASLEKQIASSSVFIINKIDAASTETICETKRVIEKYHPSPKYFETTYGDIPLDPFFGFDERTAKESESPDLKSPTSRALSNDELEAFMDDLLDDPSLEITPPDMLVSVTYEWSGDNLTEIHMMAALLPDIVVRAKGFLEVAGSIHIFNFVMGDWTIHTVDISKQRIKHKNVVVFIGPPDSMEGIETATNSGNWNSRDILQPFSRT